MARTRDPVRAKMTPGFFGSRGFCRLSKNVKSGYAEENENMKL